MVVTAQHHDGPLVIVATIITMVLAGIGVGLRFWANSIKKGRNDGYWWDDFMVAFALVFAYGVGICNMFGVNVGLGQAIKSLPDPNRAFTTIWKLTYADLILYAWGISFVKLSILLFYWRLFILRTGTSTRNTVFKRVLYVLFVLVIVWLLVYGFIMPLTICRPIYAFWDLYGPNQGTCANTQTYFISSCLSNIAIDIALLIAPIPAIWRIHTTTKKKFAISAVFILGFFVTTISFIRLMLSNAAVELSFFDATVTLVPNAIWTSAEVNLAVLNACLPSMTKLFRMLHQKIICVYKRQFPAKETKTLQPAWAAKKGHRSSGSDATSMGPILDSQATTANESLAHSIHTLKDDVPMLEMPPQLPSICITPDVEYLTQGRKYSRSM